MTQRTHDGREPAGGFRRGMRRAPVRLMILTAVTAAAASGCSPSRASEAAEAGQLTTVRVEELRRADIAEVLSYVADLKPYTEVRVYSPVPDRILSFPWKDGDPIQRGQRIALIRKEGLVKGLEQMSAQMEALDAQLANLKSELERSRELLAAGVITRRVFDQVQSSYQATLAQRKALEAGKGQLAVTAGNAEITAPISGFVASKMLEEGDMAVPQIPLCRILSVDRLKTDLRLVEKDVAKVHVGDEVRLHLDAYPGQTFLGKVTGIRPYLDPATRTNTAEVTLDNPRGADGKPLLKPGMFGRAELVIGTHDKAVAAPERALLLDSGLLDQQKGDEVLRKAFVIDEGDVARQRLVRLGARNGALYQVLDGLHAGERVVVRGQHGLKDGERVEVVTATEN